MPVSRQNRLFRRHHRGDIQCSIKGANVDTGTERTKIQSGPPGHAPPWQGPCPDQKGPSPIRVPYSIHGVVLLAFVRWFSTETTPSVDSGREGCRPHRAWSPDLAGPWGFTQAAWVPPQAIVLRPFGADHGSTGRIGLGRAPSVEARLQFEKAERTLAGCQGSAET